jgi:hypothetical protein
MISNYETWFGTKPRDYISPLEKNDHQELDDSELLDNDGIKLYQSMTGALQWAVSLGRFDILTAVMTMSRFCTAPRHMHLARLQHIYGYLQKFHSASMRVSTSKTDLSTYQDIDHDWAYSMCGDVEELIPVDIPEPLGETVVLLHYADANLYHDLITGRAVSGMIHFINQTPIEWYSKKQATVETATYGRSSSNHNLLD